MWKTFTNEGIVTNQNMEADLLYQNRKYLQILRMWTTQSVTDTSTQSECGRRSPREALLKN